MKRLWICALLALAPLSAQVAEIEHRIEELRTVGRVLMIAAHPDDENTAFLAYCSKGRHLRTAYLSLTRGEGGQNLIGSEQGALLGLIRTQELLAARRIDGAEQFFTRAIDFGFSKTADETLQKWGHDAALGDVVWVIRKFRPDVIVLRFSGTPRDGHGQHQASAILGKEAFRAAADPARFPEQLKHVKPWQAKRLLWNGFSFTRQQEQEVEAMPNRLRVDLGEFDALLGVSYGELAGISRSQHRSQAMGSAERKGSMPNFLLHVDGDQAQKDFMDGVDTTWTRLPGGAAVDTILANVAKQFDGDAPQGILPLLIEARRRVAAIGHPDAAAKLSEIDETIAMAAGLWLDVSVNTSEAVRGQRVNLQLTAVSRLATGLRLESASVDGVGSDTSLTDAPVELPRNIAVTRTAQLTIPGSAPLTQPYWLREAPKGALYTVSPDDDHSLPEAAPPLVARFKLNAGGETIELTRPVEYRYVDRLRGEMTKPFAVVAPVSTRITSAAVLFPNAQAKTVTVEAVALSANAEAPVRLQAPPGWKVEPEEAKFQAKEKGETRTFVFSVTPDGASPKALLEVAGGTEVTRIEYDHIPTQTVQTATRARAVRDDVRITAKRIGYVMGAGDEVPAALRQLGCEVTLLGAADLAGGDLARFDAIIAGVRAWNVREDLRANYARLREYVENGGTVVTQYNVLEGFFGSGDQSIFKNIGPFPVKYGRDRVTVEEAPVEMLSASHPLLTTPNRIGARDFDGWVQERGLYFPAEWDAHYEPLLSMHDPGEAPLKGAVLAARHGKGLYILTSLSFFRQLPAGVPGAYRLFANLVSGGKAQ